MENKIQSYKDLIVWQKAITVVTDIYAVSKLFPAEEKFGLVSQLNRAVVSIPANIAEGWGRESSKNYLQFLKISRGSIMEVETLLIISHNLKYISIEVFTDLSTKLDEVGRILQGVIKSINEKIKLTTL
ncbi:MAG: four helix bundle protein [Flavobacteriales bacterium]